jgi:hypothetical protein
MQEESNTDAAENKNAMDESNADVGEGFESGRQTDVSRLSDVGNDQLKKESPPEPTTVQDEKNSTHLATIRTLESDAQHAMEEEEASIADIHQAEQKKQQKKSRREANTATTDSGTSFSLRNAVWGSLILFFLASAVGIVGFVYYTQDDQDPFARGRVSPQEIIFANTRSEITANDKTNDEVVAAMQAATSSDYSTGTIQNVYFTTAATNTPQQKKRLLSPAEFVELLDSKIPSSLVSTFEDRFMFGYHYQDSAAPAPFFIFAIDSYENAFAASLFWEGSMEADLYPLIGPRPRATSADTPPAQSQSTSTNATTTATSTNQTESTTTPDTQGTNTPTRVADTLAEATTTETAQIQEDESLLSYYTQRPFDDMVVQNRDTRVLRLDNGQIRLIYALPRQDFLVITTNRATLTEIFDRLSQRQLES